MPTATKTDTAPVRRLLADLHAAGWRHTVEHEEGDRDWETGALEGDGYTIHRWTRGLDQIEACWSKDHKRFIGQITYGPVEDEVSMFGPDTRIIVGVRRVEQRGLGELYRLAEAAGVLPAKEATS